MTLSKSFQKGAINYGSIKPSIDYSKDRLNDVKITEEPIKQLEQDLSSGGRLETLELVCTESNVRDLQGLLQKYIKALVKNIDKRFKSSLPVLSAFSAFDPMLIPNRQSPAFHSHVASHAVVFRGVVLPFSPLTPAYPSSTFLSAAYPITLYLLMAGRLTSTAGRFRGNTCR